VFAHIGDSWAFRLGDGELRQITGDHTVGKLVWNAGLLAPVLARYMDGRPDRSADLAGGTCGPQIATCCARAA